MSLPGLTYTIFENCRTIIKNTPEMDSPTRRPRSKVQRSNSDGASRPSVKSKSTLLAPNPPNFHRSTSFLGAVQGGAIEDSELDEEEPTPHRSSSTNSLDKIDSKETHRKLSGPTTNCASRLVKLCPKEVAAQLTKDDHSVFVGIKPDELRSLSWNKVNKHEIAPNVAAIIRRFNLVTFWAGLFTSSFFLNPFFAVFLVSLD